MSGPINRRANQVARQVMFGDGIDQGRLKPANLGILEAQCSEGLNVLIDQCGVVQRRKNDRHFTRRIGGLRCKKTGPQQFLGGRLQCARTEVARTEIPPAPPAPAAALRRGASPARGRFIALSRAKSSSR